MSDEEVRFGLLMVARMKKAVFWVVSSERRLTTL
jgi:hypothetical protein